MTTRNGKLARSAILSSSRHRFVTKFSFGLTATTLVLLGVLSILYSDDFCSSSSSTASTTVTCGISNCRHLEDAADDDGSRNDNQNDDENNSKGNDYGQYSCRYIYNEVPDAGPSQCAFAQTCNDGEGIWASWLFCSSSSSFGGFYTLFAIVSPVVLLWLITLFRLLGSTAEDFFSCSLEMFSIKLGLPPRFAGVTLLALGNGAADVSATISAITSDEKIGYKLSLGALTGAAMFVGGIVSGVVILTAGVVPCRGALIRDVTALLCTVGVVWTYLSSGVVTTSTTTVFLSLYGLYCSLVLAADVYHRTVVLTRWAVDAASSNHVEGNDHVDGVNGAENNNNVVDGLRPTTNVFQRFVTAFSNYDNISSLNLGSLTTTGPHDSSMEPPTAVMSSPESPFHDEPIILHGDNGVLSSGGGNHVHTPPSNLEMETVGGDGGGNYTLVEDSMDRVCVGEESTGIPSLNWIDTIHNGKQEISNELQRLWFEIFTSNDEFYNNENNGDSDGIEDDEERLKHYERFLLFLELPFTVLRKATIPIPCEGYYNRGFVSLSMIFSPWWFAYYLLIEHDTNILSRTYFPYFFFYVGLCTAIGLLLLRFAPGGEGHVSLIVATPIAFYGFIMAASWIDYIADNLVALLDFIGIVLHIPGTIMGLTILAWGNSVADLSANVAMARKGFANMSMTACTAGPVFNILVGLGLGFRSLENQTGKVDSSVSLSASIVTGFVFILINCITTLVFGCLIGKGRIESYYGYVAVLLYTVYVITSITVEFHHGR